MAVRPDCVCFVGGLSARTLCAFNLARSLRHKWCVKENRFGDSKVAVVVNAKRRSALPWLAGVKNFTLARSQIAISMRTHVSAPICFVFAEPALRLLNGRNKQTHTHRKCAELVFNGPSKRDIVLPDSQPIVYFLSLPSSFSIRFIMISQ